SYPRLSFTDPAPTAIYTLSLHDALPILLINGPSAQVATSGQRDLRPAEAAQQSAHQIVAGADLPGQLIGDLSVADVGTVDVHSRSEEHTSELQSRFDLVCRLLLEKKNEY